MKIPPSDDQGMARPWLLRGAVVAVALVVGIATWVATSDDDEVSAPPPAEARIVSEDELGGVAAALAYPVYWAGTISGTDLELTEGSDGSARVRYLGEGSIAGDESTAQLTVGSYPLADPAAALESFAAEPGAIMRRSRDGREVVTSEESPTSVYFVSPDNSVQVEVYDPSPERAMALALSGRVRPAG